MSVATAEVNGMWSLLDQVAPTATVRASEDTLCYLIDAEVAHQVLRSRAGIAFITASVTWVDTRSRTRKFAA